MVAGSNNWLTPFIAPAMVEVDSNWNWVCTICTEIPNYKNDTIEVIKIPKVRHKVLKTWWEIRAGIVWGDGTQVTGNDVAKTVNMIKKQLIKSKSFELFPIRSIRINKDNPRKFAIIFNQVRSDFFQLLNISLIPSHIVSEIAFSAGSPSDSPEKVIIKWYDKQKKIISMKEPNPALYYGSWYPFKQDSKKLILKKHPKYASKHPLKNENFSKIKIKRYLSSNSLINAIKNNSIDLILEGNLTVHEATSLINNQQNMAANERNFRVISTAGSKLEQLIFNLRNPKLAEPGIRQAIAISIDRSRINKILLKEFGEIPAHIFHPNDPFYTDIKKEYFFDPKKAEKLFLDAGWIKSKDNYIYKNKSRFEIDIVTTKSKLRSKILKLIKEDLKKAGIKVNLIFQNKKTFFTDTIKKANFRDIALISWNRIPAGIPWETFHSQQIPSMINDYSGLNIGGWHRREVNQVLEDMVKDIKYEKQKELSGKLMEIFSLELPTIPLFFTPSFAVISKKVKGFQLSGHIYGSSEAHTRWYKKM